MEIILLTTSTQQDNLTFYTCVPKVLTFLLLTFLSSLFSFHFNLLQNKYMLNPHCLLCSMLFCFQIV